MIIAKCFTNIDEFKNEKWPTKFLCRPMKGDWVRAESGKILKIVNITHTTLDYLRVELHYA